MSDDDTQEHRGFKVQDRRRFSESGEAKPGGDEAPAREPATDTGAPGATSPGAEHAAPSDTPFAEINFSTFIISLSTQALAYLGEIQNPIDRQTVMDLSAAKQLIDILGLLQEKTKGNLDTAEAGLLENILYDLRLRYVERARGGAKGN